MVEQRGATPCNWEIVQHPGTVFIYFAKNLGVLDLDRLDRGWSGWLPVTSRDFTSLSYLDFVLRVQARVLRGRENALAVHTFGIVPPGWLTGWALAGYSVLAALALAVASHDTTPPDRPPAAEQAATWCAAQLHARGVTPAPGGCDPRP